MDAFVSMAYRIAPVALRANPLASPENPVFRVQTSLFVVVLCGLFTAALLAPPSASAQGVRGTGLMLKTAWPLDELSNTHERAWGLSAVVRSQVEGSQTWFHGQASYLNFRGKEIQLPSSVEQLDSAEIFGLTMGIMAGLTQKLYLGVEGGYYFGDDHSWGVAPFVSIIHNNWELMGDYKALGGVKWWGISLGYYMF
jgi:hypothetical protein